MALSFESVKVAYKVFHELKVKNVPSWPEDMMEWTVAERKNPEVDTVYGFDKKYDNGWENLVFFKRDPSHEFVEKFNELKGRVPNSGISKPYSENSDLWIFGWF